MNIAGNLYVYGILSNQSNSIASAYKTLLQICGGIAQLMQSTIQCLSVWVAKWE